MASSGCLLGRLVIKLRLSKFGSNTITGDCFAVLMTCVTCQGSDIANGLRLRISIRVDGNSTLSIFSSSNDSYRKFALFVSGLATGLSDQELHRNDRGEYKVRRRTARDARAGRCKGWWVFPRFFGCWVDELGYY